MSRRFIAVRACLRSRHEPVKAPEVVLNGQDIDSAEARFGGISADGSRRRYRRRQGALPTPDHHRGPLPSSDQNTRRLPPVRLRPVTKRPPMRTGRPTAPASGSNPRMTIVQEDAC